MGEAGTSRALSPDLKDKVTFGDYTLTLDGGVVSRLQHSSDLLDRASVDMFKRVLQLWGDQFRKPLPSDTLPEVEVSWLAEGRAALASLRVGGEIVTISALLSGRNDKDDDRILTAFREILSTDSRPLELSDTLTTALAERPLVLSVPLPASRPEAMHMVGELEVCLSAAFFEACE